MKNLTRLLLSATLLTTFLFFTSCEKDDPEPDGSKPLEGCCPLPSNPTQFIPIFSIAKIILITMHPKALKLMPV